MKIIKISAELEVDESVHTNPTDLLSQIEDLLSTLGTPLGLVDGETESGFDLEGEETWEES